MESVGWVVMPHIMTATDTMENDYARVPLLLTTVIHSTVILFFFNSHLELLLSSLVFLGVDLLR